VIVNGVYLLIIVGAYAAYRLGCWVHERAAYSQYPTNEGDN
jgi:hypothetical protein